MSCGGRGACGDRGSEVASRRGRETRRARGSRKMSLRDLSTRACTCASTPRETSKMKSAGIATSTPPKCRAPPAGVLCGRASGSCKAGANACGARPVVRAEHGIVRGGVSFGRKCRAEKESRRIRNDTGLQQHMKRAGAEHGPTYLCGRNWVCFEVDSSCIWGARSGNGPGETNIKQARRKQKHSGRARRAARGKTRRRRASFLE